LIVGFEAEIDMEEWDDGTSWMGSLVSLRSDLLRGDLRCLYLGWLLCVQNQEVADKKPSPPVPPSLGQLSASLESLFQAKIENLRVKHAAKVSFLQRLERANL
jgi:hypothetical protein